MSLPPIDYDFDKGAAAIGDAPPKESNMLLRQTLVEERPETPDILAAKSRACRACLCTPGGLCEVHHKQVARSEAALKNPAGIGDVTSNAKGSGARFNAGKPDLSLIPLDLFAKGLFSKCDKDSPQHRAVRALELLGHFQRTHNVDYLYDLLDVLGLDGWEECAHVFDYGRRKYAAWNWAKGMPWSVPLACAARHLLWMVTSPTAPDNESRLPHRGHVFCNVVMLLQYAKTYTEGDDLPPKGLL